MATLPRSKLFRIRPLRGEAGATIAEAIVGAAIATVAITGLCVANADCLKIARAHRELLVANECLQQRTEQYRAATWTQITDANGVQSLLNQPPVSNIQALQNQAEKITVSAYPAVTPAVTPIVVTRTGGSASIVSQPAPGFYLRNSVAVRIDFQETWNSAQGGRLRTRETSTVIALGGLMH